MHKVQRQFFRTTTGLQSGPDTFNNSRLAMTSITNLGFTHYAVSHQFQKGKLIKRYQSYQELWRVFSKQICLIGCRRQHLRAIKQTSYSAFTFVPNITSNLPIIKRANFLGNDRFFRFISISKFGSFKNPFARITRLLELQFSCERFTSFVELVFEFSTTQGSKQFCILIFREFSLSFGCF